MAEEFQQTKLFQICLNILQNEYENTSNSLQLMLQQLNQLKDILHQLNEVNFFKLYPILLKTLTRIIAKSLLIEKSEIIEIKRVISCVEIEVELFNLVKKYQATGQVRENTASASSSSQYFSNHHPTISSLYNTNQTLLNKLILLNTACLESLKNSLSSLASSSQSDRKINADYEHLQSFILNFFKIILFIWGYQIGENIIQALTGPYLAQLVQSCLILSKLSNSKQIALESLEVLTSLIVVTSHITSNKQISSTSQIQTWKSFFPGIFSSLYILCTTLHQRNTPVLATSLNCLLTLTTVVINDVDNSIIVNQLTESSDDPYEAMLRSVATHGGSILNQSPSILSSTHRPKSSETEINQTEIESQLQWRVDIAQRIKQHIPLAFRHVWNSLSNTFVRYQTLLLSSLYHLICSSVKFLGITVSAEFCLLMIDVSYHSKSLEIKELIQSYLKKWGQDIPSSVWGEMQSVFIQRFVENFQKLDPLLPSLGGGGREDRITSLLSEIIGCANLLPQSALQTCMSILLSNQSQSQSQSDHKGSKWKGGIRNLQRLFCPDIGSPSDGNKICLLTNRRYYNHQYQLYFDAGYYRSPYLHMRMGGTNVESLLGDKTTFVSGEDSFRGVFLMQYIAIIFGSCNLSLNTILAMWKHSLLSLEKYLSQYISNSYDYYTTRGRGGGGDGDQEIPSIDEDVEETVYENSFSNKRVKRLLLTAISNTYLMSSMISFHEKQFHEIKQNEQKKKKNLQMEQSQVSCGFCGQSGRFFDKKFKITSSSDPPLASSSCLKMMRCSKCKLTFYCSKEHQQQHWSVHKITCGTQQTPSSSQANNKDNLNHGDGSGGDVASTSINNSTPLSKQHVSNNFQFLQKMCSNIITNIIKFLRYYLSEYQQYTDNPSSQSHLLMDILISSVLELLADISFLHPNNSQSHLIEMLVPLLAIALQSSSSSLYLKISHQQSYSIVNQAALTTLSRLSLYLGYRNGREFLRTNLDYLVDEMCYILKSIRQLNEENEMKSHFSPSLLFNSSYDDRIIRVVGAVFFEIQQVSPQNDNEKENEKEDDSHVVMLLRDLVRDSLDVIDVLCNSSTNYAEDKRQDQEKISSLSINSFEFERGQKLLGPLLGLMHSLILRTISPVPGLPQQYQSSLSIRPLLFPYSFHLLSPSVSSSSLSTTTSSSLPSTLPVQSSINNSIPSKLELLVASLSEFDKLLHSRNNTTNIFQGQEDGPPDGDDDNDSESVDPNQRTYDMILNLIERIVYFLSTYDINAQVLVMTTMTAAFTRLANNRKLLLPTVHKIWPVIMNRLKEQKHLLLESYSQHSTAGAVGSCQSYLLPHLLDFVSLLAILCGDFLSIKLKEDFLPELFIILHVISDDCLQMIKRSQQQHLSLHHHQQNKQKSSISIILPTMIKSEPQSIENIPLISSQNTLPAMKLQQPNEMNQIITKNNYSQYSLSNKIISSILQCLHQLCHLSFDWQDDKMKSNNHFKYHHQQVSSNPMTELVSLCVVLLLPLLSQNQCVMVQDKTRELLIALQSLNPFVINAYLEILVSLSSSSSPSPSSSTHSTKKLKCESLWSGLLSHPVVIDSFQRYFHQIQIKKLQLSSNKQLLPSNSSKNIPHERETAMKVISSKVKRGQQVQSNETMGMSIVPSYQEILTLILGDKSIGPHLQQILK